MNIFKKIFTWIAILWIAKVFLLSLPYKFSWALETQHIFNTIWEWMSSTLWESIWNWFSTYWAVWTGIVELIVSVLLIIAFFLMFFKKNKYNYLFAIWWILATMVMIWAVFFHLITPLTTVVEWTDINWALINDWWSLFNAAVSILILGIILFIMYFKDLKTKFCKNN